MEISPIPFFHHVRNRTFVQDHRRMFRSCPACPCVFCRAREENDQGTGQCTTSVEISRSLSVMVMTLLNCPALGCRARRLDDGESDNSDKPGAPAKVQFRVASRTQDRHEVM